MAQKAKGEYIKLIVTNLQKLKQYSRPTIIYLNCKVTQEIHKKLGKLLKPSYLEKKNSADMHFFFISI